MSVKHGMLAILAQGSCYGHQLRAEFERRTGGTWPVNVGQIYNTLERLERDDLVVREGGNGELVHFSITQAGRAEATAWLASPVARAVASRDELAVKIAIAVTLPGVDGAPALHAQRKATLETLAELARMKTDDGEPETSAGMARMLVIDSMIFSAEAELRWLEHAEALLTRAAAQGTAPPLPISTDSPRRGRPAGSRTHAENDVTTA